MSNQKTYIIGNWKMNHKLHELNEFFAEIDKADLPAGNFWIAPQIAHIHCALEKSNQNNIKIGAQNCSNEEAGAFTGETSPIALKDIGASFVILGHSERRAIFSESDELINAKVKLAMESGLIPVLCVGETLSEREAGKTLEVVLGQVKAGLNAVKIKDEDSIIIAYEPVWAIGTGKTATPEQAGSVHSEIRKCLVDLYPQVGEKLSILYGGSVKPSNIDDLLKQENINGGLVGGASLKASDYIALCKAAK